MRFLQIRNIYVANFEGTIEASYVLHLDTLHDHTVYDSNCIVGNMHKGVGVAHEIISPKKTASISPDDDEAVLVR